MPVRWIGRSEPLPSPDEADARGLVAVGGDLEPDRLLDAYRRGIFPWYEDGLPILWHSPDPRFVLPVSELEVNRSLRKAIRRARYEIRLDTAFMRVVKACSVVPRPGQDGTWITGEMMQAYARLHERGWAHSAEAWLDDELVGGLYGVCIGGVFCGESMFALEPDASKVTFVHLVRQLARWDVELVDCQVATEHLARFGARDWPRATFLHALRRLTERTNRTGTWRFDDGFDPLAELPAAQPEDGHTRSA
jgi:leucyl/phenylalanyl-tRNA--protein transferase